MGAVEHVTAAIIPEEPPSPTDVVREINFHTIDRLISEFNNLTLNLEDGNLYRNNTIVDADSDDYVQFPYYFMCKTRRVYYMDGTTLPVQSVTDSFDLETGDVIFSTDTGYLYRLGDDDRWILDAGILGRPTSPNRCIEENFPTSGILRSPPQQSSEQEEYKQENETTLAQKDASTLDEKMQCVICMENQKCVAFSPCRHMCACIML